MKVFARLFLFLACVVITGAGLINVYSDNADVLGLAKELACGTKACTPTRVDRTPFAQTFELASSSGVVVVRCERSAFLFGDYACKR